ncbi:armadillo-type protein [Crucibulum laeve]|uniref:26S proteasome regulatory subunit RPN2 n=1 Tax=Crucibulum laeve TaxID=68775 RepID=A0A5C3M8T1_9AGAR|nr:armadillo-type protein [Crucibulum laeve]
MVRQQSSAAGVLALLQEPDPIFKQHALKALNPLVPQFWAEISEHIALIEALYESDELPKEARDAAALLASKVYYFLGEYDEALSFALGGANAFQAETRTYGSEEYVETIVSKAIDRYIQVRTEEQSGSKEKIDTRLQSIIEGIFQRCIDEGEYRQAIGIALESHRLDIISSIYSQTHDTSLLSYAMDAVVDTGFSLSYRDHVLRFLFPLFPQPTSGDGSPHVHALTRLLVTLSDPALTVPLLTSLVEKEKLLAYQFAFDLVEGGGQDFLESLRADLPEGDEKTKETYDKLRTILTGKESVKLYLEFLKRNNQTDLLILKNTKDALEPRSSVYHTALTLQNAFMHAGTTSDVFLRENLEWLGLASNWSKFSATAGLGVIHKGYYEQGMTILRPYLPQAGGESNVQGANYSEGGALYALGLINAGCGSDVTTYLRDTLKSVQGEVVQHGAALGLGVAGMGSKSLETFEDLKNVLFMDSAVAGEASGYAMGLIMLGTASAEPVREMLQYARETQHEKIIRGLAMGIAFIFYGRQEEADETIKLLLAEKDPILRYGGVYTLALAYAGTANNDAVRQLLHIAVSDTSDDVRRAAVTSLAFLLFKNPGQVPRIVQLLSESYNAHVRCGATLALGIACAGTGLQDAIEILEPMTKDSVDFVRQGAFIALGMILVEQSEASSPSLASTRAKYSKVVSDKHEDPMARFGAAIGQGFIDAGGRNVTISLQSRAGSTNTDAIVGMVLFCQFWYWYPLAHCACLAFSPTGIMGLNSDLKVPKFEYVSNAKPSLFAYPSSIKPPKKEAVTKVATAVLSTTAKAKAREKKKAAAEGTESMDLDEKADVKAEGDADVEMKGEEPSKDGDVSPITQSIANLADDGKASASTSKLAKKSEPPFELRPNFSRVTAAQLVYVSFPADGRYQPVRSVASGKNTKATAKPSTSGVGLGSEKYGGGGGILIFVDQHPEEEAEFIEFEAPAVQAVTAPATVDAAGNGHAVGAPTRGRHISLDENAPEADPPESFEYPFDNDS